MKFCDQCGAELRDEARFCPSCGAEQPGTVKTTETTAKQVNQNSNRNWILIISVAVVLVIAVVVCVIMLIKSSSRTEREEETTEAQMNSVMPDESGEAYFILHDKKIFFSAESGIENLVDAEDGIILPSVWKGKTKYTRKVQKGGNITEGRADQNRNLFRIEFFSLDQNGNIFYKLDEKDPMVNHLEFRVYPEKDMIPQFSEDQGVVFVTRDDSDRETKELYLADGKAIDNSFIEEDYNKYLNALKKCGGIQKLISEVERNGEEAYNSLFDWCDDSIYLRFIHEYDNTIDNIFRFISKDEEYINEYMKTYLIEQKLKKMVYSGEINYFVWIWTSNDVGELRYGLSIYASNDRLKEWLEKYKVPAFLWEEALGE